ncbi:MAG: hypothetical protein V2I24_07565 [Halieaceae bacterium]|nr:hypothetical protein [Halieaceae bacterium]
MRDQNWVAVGLDFLIVVVGVFVGLQVQEWNEAREDRIAGRVALERLADDFVIISESLERSRAAHQRYLAAATRLITMHRDGRIDEQALIADTEIVTNASTPTPFSAVYQELKSSGRLHLLSDRDLREALQRYDDYTASVRANLYHVIAEPLFRTRDRIMSMRSLKISEQAPTDFDELNRTEAINVEKFASDAELQTLLQLTYVAHSNIYVVYYGMSAEAKKIQASIARALDAG